MREIPANMASESFSKGNEAFVEENYKEAIELYSRAIEEDTSKDEYYSARSHAYLKNDQYPETIEDAGRAIQLNASNSKAYLRKGIAHFHLRQFQEAQASFEEGHRIDREDKGVISWLQRCTEQLKLTGDGKGQTSTTNVTSTPQNIDSTPSQEIPMPTGPKTRHDWYQTETHVVVTILIKNVKQEDFVMDLQERVLSVTVRLPGGSEYCLELELSHEVVPDQSRAKVFGSKIEIKLKKKEGIRWNKLEGEVEDTKIKTFQPAASSTTDAATRYPTSSHYHRDWDKIVADIKQEEKDEKLEGDAALNQLFQQIYSDGSEEVKKAMNKSFTESGGTVLSTNWGDISAKQTDVKPPDGMEYKKWDT